MAAVAAPAESTWSAEQIETLLVRLLGNLLHEDPDALRVRLLEQGHNMPIDSLDLFDVLQEFREITGLTVPVRRLGRQTMRSVSAFSRFIAEHCTP